LDPAKESYQKYCTGLTHGLKLHLILIEAYESDIFCSFI